MNCLAAAAIFLRAKIALPGQWQILALFNVATRSINEEIVFGLRFIVEMGVFYTRELDWLERACLGRF